jgi:hypothetical protein
LGQSAVESILAGGYDGKERRGEVAVDHANWMNVAVRKEIEDLNEPL